MSEARVLQFVDTNVLIYAHDVWSKDLNPGQVYDRLMVQSPF